MSANWDRGVLVTSSWHGLEEIGIMVDAEALIAHGERCGAYPVELRLEEITTATGMSVPMTKAIVGDYREHAPRVLGTVGNRYRATTPEEWRELIQAAVLAGARPTGAFSLRGGSRVLATFEIGESNGLRTNLVLADSFDGSLALTIIITTIRVVCSNTLSAAMANNEDLAKIRHTKSLGEKVELLSKGIAGALESGQKIRELFDGASSKYLSREAAIAAFDALFPEAPEDASANAKTRAENARHEARLAAAMPINRVGDKAGNLATLWNAATYLVDRRGDGSKRETRGQSDGGMLDSLLFGTRNKRLAEIRRVVDVVMADGSVEPMTVAEAVELGVDEQQIGAKLLDDMLSESD